MCEIQSRGNFNTNNISSIVSMGDQKAQAFNNQNKKERGEGTSLSNASRTLEKFRGSSIYDYRKIVGFHTAQDPVYSNKRYTNLKKY